MDVQRYPESRETWRICVCVFASAGILMRHDPRLDNHGVSLKLFTLILYSLSTMVCVLFSGSWYVVDRPHCMGVL